jgi:hypothetical protein
LIACSSAPRVDVHPHRGRRRKVVFIFNFFEELRRIPVVK